jgi:hypothetical protein
LSKYKTQFAALQNNMKVLMQENEGLKTNVTLTTQRDSTVVVLGESKKYNETVGQNEELSKVVEKAAKLTVLNTRGSAFKVQEKRYQQIKASRADMLKISFTIAENQVAQSGTKRIMFK